MTISLGEMVKALCATGGYTINFTVLSERMKHPLLALSVEQKRHGLEFCETAKKQPKGHRLCLACKALAVRRALREKKPFTGYCAFGLFEAVIPVLFENEAVCVIYIGNLCKNRETAFRRMRRAARCCEGQESDLLRAYRQVRECPKPEEELAVGGLIATYIRSILQNEPGRPESSADWRVREVTEYLEHSYSRDISVKELAASLFCHEKYLGRLYCRSTGKTIRETLNQIRLRRAARMLVEKDDSILDIALECGFSSASYFDRCFTRFYGISPREYRRKNEQV